MKRTALVVLAAFGALAVAAPAAADDGLRIADISTDDRGVQLVVDSATPLDPKTITLDVGGAQVPVTVTTASTTVQRTAVLVLDASGSMRGGPIAAARLAATDFTNHVPVGTRVGVVVVADRATVAIAPSTDRAAVQRAIAAINAAGETVLYDGLVLAIAQAGRSGVRTVVVLSDGADSGSQTTAAAVAAAAKAARVRVDAVLLGPNAANELRAIVTVSGGRVVSAPRATELVSAFRAAADGLSRQVIVRAGIPQGMAGRQVTVGVHAGGHNDDAVLVLPAQAAASVPLTPALLSTPPRWLLPVGLGALFLAAVVVVGAVLGVGRDGTRGRLSRRLAAYDGTSGPATTGIGDNAVARSAVELAGRVVRRRDLEEHLALRLEAAGLPLRPGEWLLLHAGGALGVTLLALLLTGGRPVSAMAALVVGVVAPAGYLGVKADRRRNEFHKQLPDTLQLLSGSMSAGYSFPQACDLVVREGTPPMSAELGRALAATRIGASIEESLDQVAVRMESRDFGWVVMAVRIHREVGGSLAQVLTTASHTLRERERVRRQVRTLSAEGRLSAVILGALPPVFGLYLALVRPEYLKPLFSDPIGWAMLGVMGIELAVGFFWLTRVTKVDV